MTITTIDPRARLVTVPGLGAMRDFVRGDRFRVRCLIVAKAKGGTAQVEVRP